MFFWYFGILGGSWASSEGAGNRRKRVDFTRIREFSPKTAGNCRLGVRHLRSVTLSAAEDRMTEKDREAERERERANMRERERERESDRNHERGREREQA